MPPTPDKIEEFNQMMRERDEDGLALVRKLVDFARMWRFCEQRRCRRARRCLDGRACEEKHRADILRFRRRQMNPYLRRRYPNVQWGAPARVVEAQFQAALAAEKESEDRAAPKARSHAPARSR